jgi:TolB-like protein/tetratricopeptide (TPR) repeat protein
MSDRSEKAYAFGRWRLLPLSRRLLAGAEPIPLGSRTFDLLLTLVEARGALVTKDELLRRVWPGTVVEESNLAVQVSALRKALGEDAPALIVTIQGRGYRFTGTIRENAESPPAPAAGRPMLVVLPFDNMTGDPAQNYFADGMTEDLTTALSHLRWFAVIARNSAFTYKGRAVDVRRVGRELGVRYALEGSVRRSADRVRITAQLCDTDSGLHVWADRFDGRLTDVFDFQDHVTEAVAGAVEPSLRQAETLRARRKPTESLDAYDLHLRAMAHYDAVSREENEQASSLLARALAMDPGFVAAKGAFAIVCVQRFYQGWAPLDSLGEGVRLARQLADGAGDADPSALARAAHALTFLGRDYEAGAAASDRAVRLAPNAAVALYLSGWNRLYVGDWETALTQIARAIRLSPVDPGMFYYTTAMAAAHFVGGQYAETADSARRAIHDRPSYLVPHRLLASALANLGKLDEARAAVPGILAAAPGYTVAAAAAHSAFRGAVRERYLEGLRRAGLPE